MQKIAPRFLLLIQHFPAKDQFRLVSNGVWVCMKNTHLSSLFLDIVHQEKNRMREQPFYKTLFVLL